MSAYIADMGIESLLKEVDKRKNIAEVYNPQSQTVAVESLETFNHTIHPNGHLSVAETSLLHTAISNAIQAVFAMPFRRPRHKRG